MPLIVSVQQGMKSIIVIKSKEVRTMKKNLLIFVFLLTLFSTGSLYNTLAHLEEVENQIVEEVYIDLFPEQMPEVIMNPVVGFPLY